MRQICYKDSTWPIDFEPRRQIESHNDIICSSQPISRGRLKQMQSSYAYTNIVTDLNLDAKNCQLHYFGQQIGLITANPVEADFNIESNKSYTQSVFDCSTVLEYRNNEVKPLISILANGVEFDELSALEIVAKKVNFIDR